MTLTEYQTYEGPHGFRDELLDGELILSPSANAWHAELCHRVQQILSDIVPDTFAVRLDTTMKLDEDEEHGNRPRPDVFVIGRDRWDDAIRRGGYPEGSPEMAIEVLSPSTARIDRTIKVPRYLQAGSHAVLLVDGDRKVVTLITANESTEYPAGTSISLPLALGGRTFAVEDLFR